MHDKLIALHLVSMRDKMCARVRDSIRKIFFANYKRIPIHDQRSYDRYFVIYIFYNELCSACQLCISHNFKHS